MLKKKKGIFLGILFFVFIVVGTSFFFLTNHSKLEKHTKAKLVFNLDQ
ncbi:hypothetical protein [Inediibacterium massiliense]|nr:hypothetical protein [Inediibacterium massiliense]